MLKAPLRPLQKPSPVDPNKKSVLPDENTWLWEAYDAIKIALTKSIQPLYEYVQTFSKFKEENELDVNKYIKELDNPDDPIDADGLKADIHRIRELELELQERIPESVTVSIFTVYIKDIRNGYCGKYQQIVEKEIKLISQRAMDMNYEISTQFDEINERIQRPPKDIMELTETKKYISEIGIKIEKLKLEIDNCMHCYDICDEFHYEFSGSQNDDKWALFGSPATIMATIEAQTQILEKAKENMIKELEQEQEEFEETLDSLGITVGGFAAYDDLTKYAEIAENVESVNARLAECLEQSRLFTQKEFLVGKEPRDYRRLGEMQKEFKPFSDLWLNTKTWFSRHEAWTTGPWEEIDPEELDQTFENVQKSIAGATKYFKNRDFPKILANA